MHNRVAGNPEDVAVAKSLSDLSHMVYTSVDEKSNVPDYKVNVPETGEIGALSSIVNTHWSLLYWEPMRAYFQKGEVSA